MTRQNPNNAAPVASSPLLLSTPGSTDSTLNDVAPGKDSRGGAKVARVGSWTVLGPAGLVRGREALTVRCDCGHVCERVESSLHRNPMCKLCEFRRSQRTREEREERHAVTEFALRDIQNVRSETLRLLADGVIERRDACETCGGNVGLAMHHRDYRRAWDVAFLCVGCHQTEHRRLRAEGADPVEMFALWLASQRAGRALRAMETAQPGVE